MGTGSRGDVFVVSQNPSKTFEQIDGFHSESNCIVKKARFYEFVFTLGWKQDENNRK